MSAQRAETVKPQEAALKPIIDFDKRIRFVILLASDGKLVAMKKRDKVESLEPDDHTVKFFLRTALMKGMGDQENRYHGKVKTVIVIRDKLMLIVFNVVDRMILLSAEPSFPLAKVEKLGNAIDTMDLGLV